MHSARCTNAARAPAAGLRGANPVLPRHVAIGKQRASPAAGVSSKPAAARTARHVVPKARSAPTAPHGLLPSAVAADSAPAVGDAPAVAPAGPPLPTTASALIVGGGPAGLAAALSLSARGWRDVVVLERRDSVTYADADRSYVYSIDARGRRLMERHGLMETLEEAGLSTAIVNLVRVYPDGKKDQRQQVVKDTTRVTHWIPRPGFVKILADALSKPPHAGRVTVVTSAAVAALHRSGAPGGGVEVDVDGPGGTRVTLRPSLVLACDGAASAVRGALQEWAAADPALRAAAGSFGTVSLPCPSAGLRFKVLQLPANPKLKDGSELGNSGFALLQGGPSKTLGAATPIRVGLLPFRDADAPRTANLITAEGHPVWDITDAETMYKVFEESLPQADWRALVPPDTMERFAASRGGAFPAPTYSDGAAADVDGAAVLLLGDALHCFPPDLGQGVNSALLDVMALEGVLSDTRTGAPAAVGAAAAAPSKTEGTEEGPATVDLSAAAAEYQRRQLPQAIALCNLLPIGFPFQYTNCWRRRLFNVVFLAQMVAHKLLPFLIPPPAFMMVQDANLDYATILHRARRAQFVGRALFFLALGLVFGFVARLATRAAGAA